MQYELLLAGFGGQGIMTMGTILATAGMRAGRHVTWIPSYGAEQRGGTANCQVVIGDEPIGSPILDHPGILIAMNQPSLDKFEPMPSAQGLIFYNSSLIVTPPSRTDVTAVDVPVNELAAKAGSPKAANVVMLGALVGKTALLDRQTLEAAIREYIGKKEKLLQVNMDAVEAGFAWVARSAT